MPPTALAYTVPPPIARALDAVREFEQQAQEFSAVGKPDEAAKQLQLALQLRCKVLGPGDASLQGTAEALAQAACVASRAELRACVDVSSAAERLQTVLALLAEVAAGLPKVCLARSFCLVLVTFGSLKQRLNQTEAALACLREAEVLGRTLPPNEAASTQLSLCTLLSQLGRHEEAERAAAEAVQLGEADILDLPSLGKGAVDGVALLQEKASALAVAYNNLAVQREFLGQSDCVALYEKAVVLAEGHMAPHDPLLVRLRESHRNALHTAQKQVPVARLASGTHMRPLMAVPPRMVGSSYRHERGNIKPQGEEEILSARSLSRELANLLRPGTPRGIAPSRAQRGRCHPPEPCQQTRVNESACSSGSTACRPGSCDREQADNLVQTQRPSGSAGRARAASHEPRQLVRNR